MEFPRVSFPAGVGLAVLAGIGWACGGSSLSRAPGPAPTLAGWDPAVAEALGHLLTEAHDREGAPPLAVLDCDNTLIDGDVSYAFLAFLVREEPDPVSRETRLGDLYGTFLEGWEGGREAEACGWLAGLLAGLSPAEAREAAEHSLDQTLQAPRCLRRLPARNGRGEAILESGIRFRPPMRSLLRLLEQQGWEVWLVSASAQPLVEAAAVHHGIPPGRVLGVRTEVRGDRLTREVQGPVPWRQGKVDAIRAAIGRRPDLAVGDAWTDFEMLTMARLGVLVDRGDVALREAARDQGIRIQPRFEGPDIPPCGP